MKNVRKTDIWETGQWDRNTRARRAGEGDGDRAARRPHHNRMAWRPALKMRETSDFGRSEEEKSRQQRWESDGKVPPAQIKSYLICC